MLEKNARIFLSVDISILLDGSISFGYLFFFRFMARFADDNG